MKTVVCQRGDHELCLGDTHPSSSCYSPCDCECHSIPPAKGLPYIAGTDPGTVYRNKKNGELYVVLGLVRNSTNAQDGQVMVEYAPLYVPDGGWSKVVREWKEFMEKFEVVG